MMRQIINSVINIIQQYPQLMTDYADHFRNLPDNQHHGLLSFGYKVYSQCDEDGIIAEIFQRIGIANKKFIEIGVGDGRENNTTYLLTLGWHGLWLEGNPRQCQSIRKQLVNALHSQALRLEESFIDEPRAEEYVKKYQAFSGLDLLSIDIDGNDYYVLRQFIELKPRVVVLEYNSRLRPPVKWCMPYNPSHRWQKDDYYGFSLSFITEYMKQQGYVLVSCNLSGNNCFFVAEQEMKDKFKSPFTAEHLYQPARFHFCQRTGHAVSLKVVDALFRS